MSLDILIFVLTPCLLFMNAFLSLGAFDLFISLLYLDLYVLGYDALIS